MRTSRFRDRSRISICSGHLLVRMVHHHNRKRFMLGVTLLITTDLLDRVFAFISSPGHAVLFSVALFFIAVRKCLTERCHH